MTSENDESRSSVEISLSEKIISAGLGAILTSLMVTPMDVVKVRLQVQGMTVERTPNTCNSSFTSTDNLKTTTSTSTSTSKTTSSSTCKSASASVSNNPAYLPNAFTKTGKLPPPGRYFFHQQIPEHFIFCNDFHDTVKPFIQDDFSSKQRQHCNFPNCMDSVEQLSSSTSRKPFRGTWDATKSILRDEGISSLWRGLIPTLVMSIPATIVYYVGYDYWKNRISKVVSNSSSDRMAANISYFSPLISGGLSRAIAATAISPLELVKTRIQAAPMTQSTSEILSEISGLVKSEGLGIMWRGLSPTLWRDVPFSAIYWMGYESIKNFVSEKQGNHLQNHNEMGGWIAWKNSFIAGASSGIIAATVTTPFDVAKTRRQVSHGPIVVVTSSSRTTNNKSFKANTPTLITTKRYNVFSALLDIWQEEGWRGLTRGITARVAKVAPACAIMISSYEIGKYYFINLK